MYKSSHPWKRPLVILAQAVFKGAGTSCTSTFRWLWWFLGIIIPVGMPSINVQCFLQATNVGANRTVSKIVVIYISIAEQKYPVFWCHLYIYILHWDEGNAKTYPQLLLMHVVIFWKIENISVKIRTLCLCYRREIGACLKDYFSKIYRLQKCSQSCPHMTQSWRSGFSALPRLCQTCSIVTSSDVGWFLCGWENNPLVILYAQCPENPLRKYTNIQDIPDGKKDYFRCGHFSGRTPFFTDLSSACRVHRGLQPCPTCQEQQLEHSLWLQCEGRKACDDLKSGQVGREQSTNQSS